MAVKKKQSKVKKSAKKTKAKATKKKPSVAKPAGKKSLKKKSLPSGKKLTKSAKKKSSVSLKKSKSIKKKPASAKRSVKKTDPKKEGPLLKKSKKALKNQVLSSKDEKLLNENEKKWSDLYKKSKNIKPIPFRVSGKYETKSALKHSEFGWGWILSNTNNRLEVVFRDKVRMLLSNQPEQILKSKIRVSKKK